MNDMRLWFVFLGMGMVTTFALNPTDPMIPANGLTTLPVTTVALVVMLGATALVGAWNDRMRRQILQGLSPDPRPASSSAWLSAIFSFAMAMQIVVLWSESGPTTLPSWSAPWAFLGLTLATELALLQFYEMVVETCKAGRTATGFESNRNDRPTPSSASRLGWWNGDR